LPAKDAQGVPGVLERPLRFALQQLLDRPHHVAHTLLGFGMGAQIAHQRQGDERCDQ
jgi:hypothetical protein